MAVEILPPTASCPWTCRPPVKQQQLQALDTKTCLVLCMQWCKALSWNHPSLEDSGRQIWARITYVSTGFRTHGNVNTDSCSHHNMALVHTYCLWSNSTRKLTDNKIKNKSFHRGELKPILMLRYSKHYI